MVQFNLLKFPPGRTSEQDFTFNVNAIATSSYGSLGEDSVGNDVIAPSTRTLTFSATEQMKSFEIEILDDIIPEYNETFSLSIYSSGDVYRFVCVTGCHSFVTVTIVDNDGNIHIACHEQSVIHLNLIIILV